MARKRRDKERDSSTAQKITKVGIAALAVGGGAALFNNSSFGKKFYSELVPSAIKTGKTLSKELRDSKALRSGLDKRNTLDDYRKAFSKSKKVYVKEMAERATGKKIRTDLSKKNTLAGFVKNTHQVINGDLKLAIKDNYKSQLEEQLINVLQKTYSEKNSKQVRNLAQNAYKAIKANTIKTKDDQLIFSNFLDKSFKKANFNDIEKNNFLNIIYSTRNEIDELVKNSNISTKHAYDKAKEHLLANLKHAKKRKDTFFGKVDALTKKHLGVDLDSQMLMSGSREMTLGDLRNLATEDNFDFKSLSFPVLNSQGKTKFNTMNVKDILDSMKNLDDDIIFDSSIRVDKNNNLFSIAEVNKIKDTISDNVANSTLGKIFWGTDLRLDKNTPLVTNFRALSTDITAVYDVGNEAGDTLLKTSKLAINNSLIGRAELFETSLDESGNLIMSDVLEEGVLFNNSHGKRARLLKEILGTNKEILTANDRKLFKTLDIDQTGAPNVAERLKSVFTKGKSDTYVRNILKRQKGFLSSDLSTEEKIAKLASLQVNKLGIPDTEENLLSASANIANLILEDNKKVSSMINNITARNQITDETISTLVNIGKIQDEKSLEILNILNNKEYSNAEELLNMISIGLDDNVYNKDLENIYKRGLANSDYVSNMLNISQSNTKNIFNYSIESTNAMKLEQIVKREAIKEVLLRESNTGSKEGIFILENILQDASLTPEQSKNLRYLANWSIMENRLKIYNDIDADLSLDDLVGYGATLKEFDNLMTVSGSFRKGYTDMIDDLASRENIFESSIGNINESYYNEYNNYAFMKKSKVSSLGQVESINDAIKAIADTGKELLAGRDDLKNYTTATQLPQFFLARLGWGVESLGLNLSHESTKSTLDYFKNIALKRVLPAMAIYNAYDYLNYESENFTGVSVTGAAANAVANIDIASRKLAYKTGIGQAIDWFKETSVVSDYWTSSTDFQTAEERDEWYDNGYSAVRGGRFWGFGSASEYRGGNIQYYQPNYLRRAHSNYKEVSVYGSAEEKFKHSWIPSLRHPLSTLRAAWNPYWLEQKNMDERPYPLTGKMFAEGTPWGAVLNPTVGELLKPVRSLPEIRKRLGRDGRDIRQVLKNLNDRIKSKANENDNALIIEGTDIRNATYIPYGNTGDGYANLSFVNGKAMSPGVGFMENVDEIRDYRLPTGEVIRSQGSEDYINPNGGGAIIDPTGEMASKIMSTSNNAEVVGKEIIKGINSSIKGIAKKLSTYTGSNNAYNPITMPNKTQGTYVYSNLVNQMNSAYSQYYSQQYDPNMIDKNLAADYLRDATHSVRQLSGIYNFLGDLAFGETSYKFKYADAGAMTNFSKGYWDSQLAGLGGELMEIARRFFPSEDKSIIRYNPLRNSMPEWLPNRFLTGDPFTSLPKGDMRLPGKGYETLNDLHPDNFSGADGYGAFDRFKILADIAPTSEEYKTWRNIARNTVTDPELIEQIEEIQSRASKMSGKHEFFNYRYTNNNVEMNKGVVKSIDGSIVELVSGEKLNLGGIKLLEDAEVTQALQIGQKIHYRTSANAIKRLEDGIITNAVIYRKDLVGATNINKTLIDMGMAEKDKDDRSTIGYLANAGEVQQTFGAMQELIAHANIPILHNKFMKIETARESFLNEQVYGNAFTTWDHPIKGFIKPAFNRVSGQSMLQHAGAVASTALFMNIGKMTSEPLAKYGAAGLMMLNNPTALLGAGIGTAWNLGLKATGINGRTNFEIGAGIGAALGTVAWGWNNADNPLKAASSFAFAGETLAKYLKAESNGKWGLVGAGIGLAISAIKNPRMNKDMFKSKWIPEETRRKFEIDEYFDRLEYVKYKGLYNQAANRAFIFEGSVNVRHMFNKLDKNKKKISDLTKKAEKLSNKYIAGGYEYEEKMNEINQKIASLQSQRTMLKGGKYTKAAIAYKKAMESTIYGMQEGATQDEILASVPDQYKDYYINFMNETNKNEREKILKMLPEYLRKPLQIAWKQRVNHLESNRKFFRKNALPGISWKGWKPNINLKHIKMKTIENEGMLLSDFGYYESEKSKMEYHMADDINNIDKGQSGLSYLANMTSALSGLGVSLNNISVEQSSSPGLWIVGDIKQTTSDIFKVGQYGVASGLQGLTSILF